MTYAAETRRKVVIALHCFGEEPFLVLLRNHCTVQSLDEPIGAITAEGFVGVLLAGRFAETIGLGRATRICAVVAALAIFLIPAASLGPAFPALFTYGVLFGRSATVWAISMTTTQQLVTPPHLQGRGAGSCRPRSSERCRSVRSVAVPWQPAGAMSPCSWARRRWRCPPPPACGFRRGVRPGPGRAQGPAGKGP
jgi:hypothetical protein